MSGQTVLHVVEQVWCGKSKGGGHESGGSGRDCRQRNGGGQPALVTGGSKGGEAARFLAEEAVGRMGLSKQVRKVEAQRGVKGAGEQHVRVNSFIQHTDRPPLARGRPTLAWAARAALPPGRMFGVGGVCPAIGGP